MLRQRILSSAARNKSTLKDIAMDYSRSAYTAREQRFKITSSILLLYTFAEARVFYHLTSIKDALEFR
jgi:hypothetical protein